MVTLAYKTIHTRAYANPNPPEIVDNPESILKKSPTPRISTISSHIHRAKSAPENFTALSDPLFDLGPQNSLPRTWSLSVLNLPDLELLGSPPQSSKHPGNRQTPPSTPPDIHFIQNFGLSHPKSSHQSSAIIISLSSTYQLPKSTLYLIKTSSWQLGMHLWFYLSL